METQDGDGKILINEFFQQGLKILAIGRGHHDAGEIIAQFFNVLDHVWIHVIIFVDLRLGKDAKAHVADGLYPWANHIGTAGGDIGKDRGLRIRIDVHRAVNQPPADGIKTRAMCRGGAPAEQGAEPHIHIGCVPHQ